MNYKYHYDRLIQTRKNRVSDSSIYYERHHIIPISMGGLNESENLIKLTAREHFRAHWLLWRLYRNKEMAFAFRAMCNYKHKCQNRKNFSSIGYKEAKEAFIYNIKEKLTGLKRSADTKKKLSEARKLFWSKKTTEERSELMKAIKIFCTHEQRTKGSIKTNLSYTHDRRSDNSKKIQASLTEDQKKDKSKTNYWASLTPEQKTERVKKLNEAKKLHHKYKIKQSTNG